jgi:hydrogenase expression/formation protein HypE
MNPAAQTKIGHQIKAILFDFDGTLTLPGALDFAAIKESIDCPPDMAILEYIDTIDEPARKTEVILILDKAEEEAASESIPNEGAEELLLWLKAHGILIGVITRNAMAPVIRSLENFNLLSMNDFNVVISREEPIQPKPDPESVLLAMERLNVDKSETIMVGDYLFDVTAGNEAGVTTILIPAAGEQRDISSWGQDLTISRLLELQDLVDFYLPLSGGKLPNRFLHNFLTSLEIKDPSILISPGVGEDTTAIDIERNEVLILKSDPVTFVSDAAAYYAVAVNANDIATSGAVPRWFLSTLLFPPGTTPSEIVTVMTEIRDCCRQLGITLCGGHTEITDAVTRPVITGMVAGTVNRADLIDKKNLSEGDQILMTKALTIEGTSILAREFEQQLLENGLTRDEIDSGKQLLEQISIIPEATIAAADNGVTAMHDITEGGLATALEELSQAGNQRIAVDVDRIPIHDLTRRMCAVFGLDPLGLIGSGSLLISCGTGHVDKLIRDLENGGIQVTIIGKALASGCGIQAEASGREVEWPSFEADELSRLYQSASRQEPE